MRVYFRIIGSSESILINLVKSLNVFKYRINKHRLDSNYSIFLFEINSNEIDSNVLIREIITSLNH